MFCKFLNKVANSHELEREVALGKLGLALTQSRASAPVDKRSLRRRIPTTAWPVRERIFQNTENRGY